MHPNKQAALTSQIRAANDSGREALSAGDFDAAEGHFTSALALLDGHIETAEPALVLTSLRGLFESLSGLGREQELSGVLLSYDPLLKLLLRTIQSKFVAPASTVGQELNPGKLVDIGATIRDFGKKADTVEQLSQFSAQLLYSELKTFTSDAKATSLVRVFHTMKYDSVLPTLQVVAREQATTKVTTDTRCLVLLGTAGVQPEWNSREFSINHKIIPLLSPEMVANSPMIARLFTELGINISSLFKARTQHSKIFLDPAKQDYNVFYVSDAVSSPHIVDTKFVVDNGIKSVVGYGSLLPSGELFAVIAFFNIFVSQAVAERFSSLALSTTIAMLSKSGRKIFDSSAS